VRLPRGGERLRVHPRRVAAPRVQKVRVEIISMHRLPPGTQTLPFLPARMRAVQPPSAAPSLSAPAPLPPVDGRASAPPRSCTTTASRIWSRWGRFTPASPLTFSAIGMRAVR
jgi:hypothetical protein